MTLGDFRTMVLSMVEMYGGQLPSSASAVNAWVIGPGLREWCRRTECLRSDRVRWAPVPGRSAIRIDDPPANSVYPPVLLADPGLDGTYGTPVGMVAVRDVWWAGLRLRTPRGDYGATSAADWDHHVGAAWATATHGTPQWWRVLGGELHVHPAPSVAAIAAAGTNVYLSGAYSHPAIVAATADTAPILVPDEQVHLAARWCAAMLRRPTATGEARAALDAEYRELLEEAASLRRRLDDEAHRGDPMVRGWDPSGATFR